MTLSTIQGDVLALVGASDVSPAEVVALVDRLAAWTSEHADALDDETHSRLLIQLARLLDPRTPGERDAAERTIGLARAGVALADARSSLPDLVREAVALGMSQAAAARVCGVDRMTVRSWLGLR